MLPNTGLASALILTVALTLTACAGAPITTEPAEPGTTETSTTPPESNSNSGAVDADGIQIPGEIVELQLGDPVTYYSYPNLSKEDLQKVTIHSFEYIEKADLEASAPLDKVETGVLVLTLSWETVEGSTQSNQGYIVTTLANGDEGRSLAFRDDRLRNGGVDLGETRTGTFSIAIDRGVTTLTIVDYMGEPVARLVIDTSA